MPKPVVVERLASSNWRFVFSQTHDVVRSLVDTCLVVGVAVRREIVHVDLCDCAGLFRCDALLLAIVVREECVRLSDQ